MKTEILYAGKELQVAADFCNHWKEFVVITDTGVISEDLDDGYIRVLTDDKNKKLSEEHYGKEIIGAMIGHKLDDDSVVGFLLEIKISKVLMIDYE